MKQYRLLKDGKESTEFTIFKYLAVTGLVLIIVSKLPSASGVSADTVGAVAGSVKSVSPDDIIAFANTIKTKTDEYIGAAMILIPAIAYMVKRAILKYAEMKQLVALARIEADEMHEEEGTLLGSKASRRAHILDPNR